MRLLLVLPAMFFAYVSFGIATLLGWGFPGDPVIDRSDALVVAMSATAGVVAAALLLAALQVRVLSPWLLLGVLPVTGYLAAANTSAI